MKILQVIRSVDPAGGGPIETIQQAGPALSRSGHVVHVASLDSPGEPWLGKTGLKIFALGPAFLHYGYSPRFTSWLFRHAAEYDCVIIRGIWQYSSFGAWRALRRTNTPYFVFPHGMLDPWFKRAYPLKHLKKMLYWPWAEYRVLRDARAVLFTSEEERVSARESFRLYKCKEEVVSYGTAPPPQDKDAKAEIFLKKFPRLAGKKIILFLGRIHPKKGCDLLIKAYAAELKNNNAFHLVMAGPDLVGWRAKLERLCVDSGIESRVTWTGMLSGDLKWGAFYSSGAFILPSHQENFGVASAEAMACGIPVLISDKVNIWREIKKDGAGLIASDTPGGTRELLEKWTRMPCNEQKIMGENARKCFLKRFEIRGASESLINTLRANGIRG